MPEQEPGSASAQTDERDEVAKLEAQLAAKKIDVERKEAFGKYDEVTPDMGEVNYQGYIDQRPADGIVRDGDQYRGPKGFASETAYKEQNGTAQAHYDKLGGIETTQEVYVAPDYSKMHFLQLEKAAGNAKVLGDRAEFEAIMDAAEKNLRDLLEAKDSKWTEADVLSQLKYMDERSEAYMNRTLGPASPDASELHLDPTATEAAAEADAPAVDEVSETSEAAAPTAPPEVAPAATPEETPDEDEAEPVAANVSLSDFSAPEESPVAPVQPEAGAGLVSSDAEAPAPAEKKTERRRTGEVKLNGETVILGEKFSSPSGREIYEVTGADGNAKYVTEAELEFVEEDVEIEEKESILDKFEQWSKERVKKIKTFFTMDFWKPIYEAGNSRIIEKGVDPEMTDAEKQHQRDLNKGKYIIGFNASKIASLGVGLYEKVKEDKKSDAEKVDAA